MSVRKLRGGHAVMLVVDRTEYVAGLQHLAGRQMGAEDGPPAWKCPRESHLTLQFVGRDLTHRQAGDMIAAAIEMLPVPIILTGETEVFGTSKGTYLVALVEKTGRLQQCRDLLRSRLEDLGLPTRDDFEWRPHVTLLEAPPRTQLQLLERCAPEEVRCHQLEIKYGERRMLVDL